MQLPSVYYQLKSKIIVEISKLIENILDWVKKNERLKSGRKSVCVKYMYGRKMFFRKPC